ncbi:hypothetical protein ISN44_As01g014850 [Arabidopsis suecica]|uniref:Uncharacterized protein n=1 Tax=Arabidopsis suecica TaxID=45249 RepID=A0A8T2H3G9_ARASU|nr:hypothetical protein ISN44_As01g014850 [Arabidopsis suecica]
MLQTLGGYIIYVHESFHAVSLFKVGDCNLKYVRSIIC